MALRLFKYALSVLFFALMCSCTLLPTTVSESDLSLIERAHTFEQSHRPIKITNETILLDVRSYFDYQVSHLAHAISVDSKEFSIRGKFGGDLQQFSLAAARKLALLGINPFSHVVIIGYGDKGHGEEGVVALTLMVLGVERVQIGTMKEFKALLRSKPESQKENQRVWEPRLVTSLVCPPLRGNEVSFVIDSSEARKSTLKTAQPMVTLPIPWRKFVRSNDFAPDFSILSQLKQEKITQATQVMVVGEQAPIVVFSLAQMGYAQVCLLDR